MLKISDLEAIQAAVFDKPLSPKFHNIFLPPLPEYKFGRVLFKATGAGIAQSV
jgi:hypothetical protein